MCVCVCVYDYVILCVHKKDSDGVLNQRVRMQNRVQKLINDINDKIAKFEELDLPLVKA